MVFIENGGHEQVLEEIRAYESLVPNGKELVLTLMVEIDNQKKIKNITTIQYLGHAKWRIWDITQSYFHRTFGGNFLHA